MLLPVIYEFKIQISVRTSFVRLYTNFSSSEIVVVRQNCEHCRLLNLVKFNTQHGCRNVVETECFIH
jgi:hypothetical protein